MMNVIIDYKVGNLKSVERGFTRAGIKTIVTNDIELVKKAKTIILPGVGAFKDAMLDLEKTDLIPVIMEHVKNGKLLIGICLGMQLLFESSSEFGFTKGLGFIDGSIELIEGNVKIPHMGWNNLKINIENELTKKVTNKDYVYFVHSFYAKTDTNNVVAYTSYSKDLPAIVQKENVIGFQFHPEKSGEVGLQLLRNLKELMI